MEIKLLPKSYPMLSQSRIVYTLFSDQWSKLPLPQLRLVISHPSFLYLSFWGMTLSYFCAVSTWNCYQMSESPDLNNNSYSCKCKSVLQVCCKCSWSNHSFTISFSCAPQISWCIKLHAGFLDTLLTIAQNPYPLFISFTAIYFHSE